MARNLRRLPLEVASAGDAAFESRHPLLEHVVVGFMMRVVDVAELLVRQTNEAGVRGSFSNT